MVFAMVDLVLLYPTYYLQMIVSSSLGVMIGVCGLSRILFGFIVKVLARKLTLINPQFSLVIIVPIR
jgi:hypothetical protein